MCRNHSHLIARFAGRDRLGREGVLTFLLENDMLQVEGPGPRGFKLILPTTGVLLVPSTLLGGSVVALPPATEEQRIFLCLLPEDATIIMPRRFIDSSDFPDSSPTMWIVSEFFPIQTSGTGETEEPPPF